MAKNWKVEDGRTGYWRGAKQNNKDCLQTVQALESQFLSTLFASWQNAEREIEEGNGRRMDGFNITVELEKTLKDRNQASVGVQSKTVHARQESRKVYSKVSQDKSYKEALLEHLNPKLHDDIHVVDGQKEEKSHVWETINIKASIPPSDLEWLNQCFVGQVKGMYDTDFVQQALRADRFKVKVSVWSSFYVIIHCLEVEQVAIFWDLKQSLLESWFEEIDTLVNFTSEKKLKIWVSIEVGVSSVSDIPLFDVVTINGEKFNVKVSTSEFEDNRCWIDEGHEEFPSEAGTWAFIFLFGLSEPTASVLDQDKGLFTIKTKYLKSSKILSPWNIRIKLDKHQSRVNSKSSPEATKSPKLSVDFDPQHSASNAPLGSKSGSHVLPRLLVDDEAEATLEVANKLGFSFIASKEQVLHHLRSVEEKFQ
ncbi:hypothetical protein V6N11_035233 [Hibiscus sabdariffa]|uniref:DUF4283 domain-containing protein n=1 Tax=Hibiscus sabdariffa TaxID=183260 RepID=A0ABR2R009_9ROSI